MSVDQARRNEPLRQTAPTAVDHHESVTHKVVEKSICASGVFQLHRRRDVVSPHAALGQHAHEATACLAVRTVESPLRLAGESARSRWVGVALPLVAERRAR